MRTSPGAFDVTGRTARYRMLTDCEQAQFRRDIAPGGYFDRLHGLHRPGGAFDARPDFATPEYSSERDRGELEARDMPPSERHLRRCLSDDDFEEYERLRDEEGDYGDEDDYGEDGEEDAEGRIRNWTGREETVADEPPPFPGRPRPGGTMDRRFSGRRGGRRWTPPRRRRSWDSRASTTASARGTRRAAPNSSTSRAA